MGHCFLPVYFSFYIDRTAILKIKETDVSAFLDQTYPQLEESSGLMLKPYESLNLLEKLQFERTQGALSNIPVPAKLNRKLSLGAAILLAAMLVYFIVPRAWHLSILSSTAPVAPSETAKSVVPEKVLPQISLLEIKIKPPAYTGKAMREQDKFNLEAEEGATIDWQVKTTMPVTAMQFIFNDSLSLSLHAADDSHTLWNFNRQVTAPGFYQVKIDSELSELYKIEMVKDQPPVIHIQTPKQYTTIDYGEAERVQSVVDLTDDYGIKDAYISATIANGSGEAVKFKEQKIAFPGFSAGSRKYQLKKMLQLTELGMQPGDELYFYVDAIDNHNQESRSDVYIVNIQDTAQLMSLEGLVFGINIKPDYFRSERQIIIETEQLIKDKSTMPEDSFKYKSNDLGIDQKLLRLRYGKFLGEEAESDIPGAQDGAQKELSDPSNFGNAGVVLDQFTDKHDNAEDASFFEPELKQQLKATLTEMWNAELQLRTYKPRDALPYEYKALRLLKDLQQKSRAYVAKTSFKSASLKPEKRLTGDLGKIGEPVKQQDFDQTTDPAEMVRSALGILEQLKTGDHVTGSIDMIARAALQLNKKAVAEPAIYLAPAQALRRILAALHDNKIVPHAELSMAENGLQHMMTEPSQLPVSAKSSGGIELSQQYFRNINRAVNKP